MNSFVRVVTKSGRTMEAFGEPPHFVCSKPNSRFSFSTTVMMKSFPRRIALRYLWSRRGEAFITIITVISVVGVAIGVMVLNVVMGVMTGFEAELREKILSANSHIVVRRVGGRLSPWRAASEKVSAVPGVLSVSAFTHHQALLKTEGGSVGLLVRGVQEGSAAAEELARALSDPAQIRHLFHPPRFNPAASGPRAEGGAPMEVGDTGAGSAGAANGAGNTAEDGYAHESAGTALPGLVIGRELSRTVGLVAGAPVMLLSPQMGSSPFGLIPRFRRFVVSGVYRSGLIEYESGLAYARLEDAQEFFGMGSSVSGFEVRVQDVDTAPTIAKRVLESLGGIGSGYVVQDWTETNRPLWEALRLEKKVYFIVLLLIIVMASFSIVTTLIMVVLEKRRDVAVLMTMGATSSDIGRIFRTMGGAIGLLGTSLGLLLGYVSCLLLQKYGFPIDERIFQMSTLPIRIEGINFLVSGVVAFLICYLATIYPARRASRLHPSEILRYE